MTETLSEVYDFPHERGDRPLDPPAELFQREPLSRLHYAGGYTGWLVTSHSLARAVLADQRFSARNEIRKGILRENTDPRPARPGSFIGMDPPEHGHYRKLLTGQFTVRRMNQLIPRIQEIASEHAAAMRRHGSPADLVPNYSMPIPSLVICEILGVPYGDREFFQDESAKLLRLNVPIEELRKVLDTMQAYIVGLAQAKRKQPGDDMLSGLIATGELTDEEIASMGFLLLIAGHETTANMLALGTYTLLTNPEQLALLRTDPGLVDGAVEELLRYLTILHFGTTRAALEDVELDGKLIPAGETVTIHLPMANRDPLRFVDPNRLNVTGSAAGHLAFGHGIHQCLGQQLARIEMRIGFTTLLREFPTLRLAVDPDQVPFRHDMAIFGVHGLEVAW